MKNKIMQWFVRLVRFDMGYFMGENKERQWREADQRAKDRYDARTNQLKAEYDVRTAAGWGKTGAVRNFCNDADYWEKQQKKY